MASWKLAVRIGKEDYLTVHFRNLVDYGTNRQDDSGTIHIRNLVDYGTNRQGRLFNGTLSQSGRLRYESVG